MRAGEIAEHDRRVERAAVASRELCRAGVAAAAAAGRDEDDRALRLARREHACELEQRRRARQFGARAVRAGARRIAVRDDHDRARVGRARALRDDRRERALAVDRLRRELARVYLKAAAGRAAEPAQRRRDVSGQRLIAAAARRARGELARERVRFGECAGAFEGVRRERRAERAGAAGQRERGDRQREDEREERRSVQPAVEHL